MMVRKPIVLITRPKAQNDEIIKDIESIGCGVIAEPMLNIVPIEIELPVFSEGNDTGFIFTSGRAVELFCSDNNKITNPVYAVGSKTAERLVDNGFEYIEYVAGNSKSMQEYLYKNEKLLPSRLLHICGVHIVTEFKLECRNIEKFTIYNAESVSSFTENLKSEIENIDIVLFYSARSAETFIKLIKQYALEEKCASMIVLCISERIAESIQDTQWGNILIASKSDNKSMINTLREIYRDILK